MIWPLLVDQYTESERVGYRFKLAQTMLHELTVSGSRRDGNAKSQNHQLIDTVGYSMLSVVSLENHIEPLGRHRNLRGLFPPANWSH